MMFSKDVFRSIIVSEVIETVFIFYEEILNKSTSSDFHQNNKPKNINKSTSSNFHQNNKLKNINKSI